MEKCRKDITVSGLICEIGNWFLSWCCLIFNLIVVMIFDEIWGVLIWWLSNLAEWIDWKYRSFCLNFSAFRCASLIVWLIYISRIWLAERPMWWGFGTICSIVFACLKLARCLLTFPGPLNLKDRKISFLASSWRFLTNVAAWICIACQSSNTEAHRIRSSQFYARRDLVFESG